MRSEPQDSRTVRREVARWISILGHPFILIPVLVAAVTVRRLPPKQAAFIVGTVILVSIVPMFLFIARRVRAGAWTNYDVSVREQRTGMYPAALAITAATVLVLAWAQVPRPILRGVLAILLLIGLAALINLWLKISLHTAFAVFTALAVLPSRGLAAGLLFLALAIAWARLELGRHTPAEVLGGALLGAAVAGGAFFL